MISFGYLNGGDMIREFEKKIENFIANKIPVSVKLVFFYGLTFYAGYMIGDYGYQNYEMAMRMACTY